MTQGEMIDILRKYYGQIKTAFEFRLVGEIKEKALKNALKIYAPGVDKNTIDVPNVKGAAAAARNAAIPTPAPAATDLSAEADNAE